MDEMEQLMVEMEIENEGIDMFFTSFGEVDGLETIAILNDQTTRHAITKENMFDEKNYQSNSSTFTFNDRYSSETFQGIMPDSGAAGISTAGEPQFIALQKIDPSIQLDRSTVGQHNICFRKGNAISLGTTNVPTPFGEITFHIVPTNTPFLLCINNIDKIKIQFNNLKNVLV